MGVACIEEGHHVLGKEGGHKISKPATLETAHGADVTGKRRICFLKKGKFREEGGFLSSEKKGERQDEGKWLVKIAT